MGSPPTQTVSQSHGMHQQIPELPSKRRAIRTAAAYMYQNHMRVTVSSLRTDQPPSECQLLPKSLLPPPAPVGQLDAQRALCKGACLLSCEGWFIQGPNVSCRVAQTLHTPSTKADLC